jgi:hypothetical protein
MVLENSGGKILLAPDIKSYYFAGSNLEDLAKNNFSNGFWVVYSNKFAKLPFYIRHLIPFAFVLSLSLCLFLSFIFQPFLYLFIFIFLLYLMFNVFFSFQISFKNGFQHFFSLITSFATLHFSYGFGSLWGLAKLFFNQKKDSKNN